MFPGIINNTSLPSLVVVDDFLRNPDEVREFALSQNFEEGSDWYKGRRTFDRFLSEQLRQRFQSLLGYEINSWDNQPMNGRFQFCTPEDPLVYHQDSQRYAGVLFLTPDAPFTTGTSFFANKSYGIRKPSGINFNTCFSGGFFDSTKFDEVDRIGNVYNRLVLFDSKQIHAASCYFGKHISDSRLFQIFFFDHEV